MDQMTLYLLYFILMFFSIHFRVDTHKISKSCENSIKLTPINLFKSDKCLYRFGHISYLSFIPNLFWVFNNLTRYGHFNKINLKSQQFSKWQKRVQELLIFAVCDDDPFEESQNYNTDYLP